MAIPEATITESPGNKKAGRGQLWMGPTARADYSSELQASAASSRRSPSAQQCDRCAPPVREEIHIFIREEADKAEKCLRVVNLPSPADEDRGAGTQSGNAGQRLRQDEEHGPESTDVPAGAAHQQQARANQQRPERNEQGPRVREEGIELRLPHVGRKSMSRRDGET